MEGLSLLHIICTAWPCLCYATSRYLQGWNRKNYMLIFHISNEVTVRMCKWGWVVRNFFIAKKNEVKCQKNDRYFNHNSGSFPYLLLLVLCCVPAGCIFGCIFGSISLLCRACVVFYMSRALCLLRLSILLACVTVVILARLWRLKQEELHANLSYLQWGHCNNV